MAATVYLERNVLGANLLSTLQTDILSQTDWARPNSGTFPTLYKATTTRGAQMAIDINIVAADLNKMSVRCYRTHDGTTGVDTADSFIRYKRTTGGAFATNTYHYVLSLGKEHFFLGIEGPRVGEAGPDSASAGSLRNYIFLNDIVPYIGSDTIPAVAFGGTPTNVAPTIAVQAHQVRISRNGGDSLAWVPGHMTSDIWPSIGVVSQMNEQRVSALDSSKVYHSPFKVWENTDGPRGRLASFFYVGHTGVDTFEAPPPSVGQIVTISSVQYKLLQVNKSDATEISWGSFGYANNAAAASINFSPIIAVPYA
jgi:hypothetical protein